MDSTVDEKETDGVAEWMCSEDPRSDSDEVLPLLPFFNYNVPHNSQGEYRGVSNPSNEERARQERRQANGTPRAGHNAGWSPQSTKFATTASNIVHPIIRSKGGRCFVES